MYDLQYTFYKVHHTVHYTVMYDDTEIDIVLHVGHYYIYSILITLHHLSSKYYTIQLLYTLYTVHCILYTV